MVSARASRAYVSGTNVLVTRLETPAGTLVLLHGQLPHYSGPNRSANRVTGFVVLLCVIVLVLINVPIAKHHSLAGLTLGGKNLFGLVTGPNMLHSYLGANLADLYSLIRPDLTVVDAFRILMDHGPTGGSLDDVKIGVTFASDNYKIEAAIPWSVFGVTPEAGQHYGFAGPQWGRQDDDTALDHGPEPAARGPGAL